MVSHPYCIFAAKIENAMKNFSFNLWSKGLALLFVCVIALAGCSKVGNKTVSTREELLAAMNDSDNTESMIYVMSDTVCSTNPELLMLLDTLYQHVRSENFPTNTKDELKWMSAYRSRLCAYYDFHEKDGDNLTEFEKANYVLDEGVRLVELDGDDSTMGIIVRNSTVYTFDVLRRYGLLSQLLSYCHNVKTQELIYKEWELYDELSCEMMSLFSDIIVLNYWSGSIVGPLRTGCWIDISESRNDMYQKVLNIVEKDLWNEKGVSLDYAQQLLTDCSIKAVEDIVSKMKSDTIESPYLNEKEAIRYNETIKSAEESIQELRPLLQKWGILWKKIDKEISHDNDEHKIEFAASSMLIEWAKIASAGW